MEKRDCLIQFKVTKREKDMIQVTSDDLNLSASDFIRQSVGQAIGINKKKEEGNSMCFIPVSKEIIDNKRAMLELEDLSKDENISLHTRKILYEMAECMEWKVLFQLKEKYPDYNGLFNMSSLNEDI